MGGATKGGAELKDSVLDTLAERKYLRGLLGAMPRGQPVVLVGSWARGTAVSPWSDIDVLVVGEGEPAPAPSRLQVMLMSSAELHRRLVAGDDFPHWALRFGVPLSGRKAWESLRRELLSRPELSSQLEAVGSRDLARMMARANSPQPMSEQDVRNALAFVRDRLKAEARPRSASQ
jgi:predicted nucleotidyltransferase